MKFSILLLILSVVATGCATKIKYCGQLVREDTEFIYCMGDEFKDNGGLTGIEKFKRLRRLYLDRAPLEDVAPLSKMTALRELDLNRTRVSDIRALASLKNLESLSVSDTKVTDISVLKSLPRITILKIAGLHLRDATPIYALPFLKDLQIVSTTMPADQVAPLRAYLKAKGVRLIPF